jgi:hypothetical protein
MSLLTTATAVEDSFFEVAEKVEDAVLHIARTLGEGFEPITERRPERPTGGFVPTTAEMADHTFDLVDHLVANLREFTSQLMASAPRTAESPPTPVKAATKAHAA